MPTARNGRSDSHVRQIKKLLLREYRSAHPEAKVDVYRYNPGSIRVRIIDPHFAGTVRAERDDAVRKMLKKHLNEDVREEINLLLLLAPEETRTSLMNLEFEDPTPSGL